MFEVKERAACSRAGMLSGDNWKAHTPNVIYPETDRLGSNIFSELALRNHTLLAKERGTWLNAMDLPGYSGMPAGLTEGQCAPAPVTLHGKTCVLRPEAVPEDIKKLRGQADIFILEGSIDLYQNSRIFIDALVKVREAIGFQSALYLPGIALPNNLALLFYLGADLLDSVRAALLSSQGYLLTCDGNWPASELEGETCSCAACVEEKPDRERLLRHNMLALQSELQRTRARIARGDLREFVEYRAKTSTRLVEMLRHLDKRYRSFQEERFPAAAGSFRATTRLSIDRPDVVRFRERVLTRYSKPATPSILVLLPCSARKPYSSSKSHGLFRSAIRESGASIHVHELIVTSPLGLVPKELELMYPAQHYDIPVTGHWYEDEKLMINKMLKEYIKNNKYKLIINHLGGDAGIIEGIDSEVTTDKSPASKEALSALRSALTGHAQDMEKRSRKERAVEEANSMARFQFGQDAEKMFEGCNVRGRYPDLKIFQGKEQVACIKSETGQLIPTNLGAEFLAGKNLYCVEMHDFELKGNLFAVGVKGAYPDIRPEDEVAIVHDGKLVGTGTAKMGAAEMTESGRGEAVRVRHKVKAQ
jgi:archaeosine synthase